MLSNAKVAIYIAWIEKINIIPSYPGRYYSRLKYNAENPDEELNIGFFNRVGRGNAGKHCRKIHGILIESLKASLFDPKLIFDILTLSGETEMPCLFYHFMTLRMYSQLTGLKPLFKRSVSDQVTYTTNHRLGMVGMMWFLCEKLVTSREQKLLLLSLLRKKLGKSSSSIQLGHQVARMRNSHTLTVKDQGVFSRVDTWRINFDSGMKLAMNHQKELFLLKTLRKYASLLSSIPDEYKSQVCGIDHISFPQKQTPAMLNFLESLHYILFNSRIEKTVIYDYFMRQYSRIMLEFTVCSTKKRVDDAMFNLFDGLSVSTTDLNILSEVSTFMKTYKFCASELNLFQKEVERMSVTSGISDARFLRKIMEKDAFWNILMFVIFSRNEWANKHSQPCLPVEVFEKLI
jgi:hypothetical protein